MGEPVTGTATVVLGDVVGSTKLWESNGDAMAAASRRLHEIADALAEKHGGHRPREQGEGDNLVAAFGTAADAVAFAMDLDAALAAEDWPGGLDVLMRLGVNTGDVTWDDDAGYLGPTFNRCARIRDLGHARQVLASAATASVVGDKLPAGVRIEDLGEHRLRDLERAEHIWQLRHAEDDREYPALRSLSNVPNNLPTPVTSLVGRGSEITEIAGLLGEHRLITLTGAGGSGKTRLAQHVAAEAAKDFPDGAWWVDLMPVADEARVPVAIAEAVRVREVAGPESIDQLAAGLADRKLLLVVDNCEHVIDLVAEILDLLILRCPGVTILATSRETISIDGEHAIRVRPLASPEDGTTADELLRHDATRLFVERARAVGTFEPTDADAPSIAAICRRLDGIPLAIELAAARTKLLSVTDIEAALDDRFR
ncbi:MAG: adenylate/guanylate cyclase domain-containing protein, partial [Nitriliruptorales bacterium]|nr:adenylate/guanylate cyclase domain-containing protein [Nitriliruptorales bacterium]